MERRSERGDAGVAVRYFTRVSRSQVSSPIPFLPTERKGNVFTGVHLSTGRAGVWWKWGVVKGGCRGMQEADVVKEGVRDIHPSPTAWGWHPLVATNTTVSTHLTRIHSCSKKKLVDLVSSFCGATDGPVLDFSWCCFIWVSKPEWAALLTLGGGVHVAMILMLGSESFTRSIAMCTERFRYGYHNVDGRHLWSSKMPPVNVTVTVAESLSVNSVACLPPEQS